jgi:tetratricopeptide (TPR) repeat protein
MAREEPGVYYLAGLYLFQTEDAYEKAAAWFRLALQKNSGHVLARCYLALCLRAMQQDTQAASLLLEGVGPETQAGAESVMLLQVLVPLELDLGRTSDAFAHATFAARLAPGSAKVQLGLGKAAWRVQDQAIALHALETAAELDPRLPDPHYLLGRIYAAQGDGRGAAEELARFKELKERARGTDQ